MLFIIALILLFLAVILIYNHKLKSAYRMLVMKNQQLIAEHNENIKLLSVRNSMTDHDHKEPAAKEQKSGNPSDYTELLAKINEVMSQTDVICDSEFNLQALAHKVDSNTKYVSAAISTTTQGSFKAMLNEYRIREVCRRLMQDKYRAFTIQAVAETVGYVSVNNFIIQFKKYTGMTPSLYRKNISELE